MQNIFRALLATVGLIAWSTFAQAEGNLVGPPPKDLRVTITGNVKTDQPKLSVTEFEMVTGKYYRLNFQSPPGWRIEAPDLLQNSHLRVLSISGVLVHLQGLSFRGIQFDDDDEGEASFSFTVLRPGTYYVLVQNRASPIGQPGAEGIPPPRQAALKLTVK